MDILSSNQGEQTIESQDNEPLLLGLKKWWPVIYLLVITGLLYLLFYDWAYDDPFITYRYAQNILGGQGLVYNPGQFVQSTTTPLFALLLAGLSIFWSDIPRLANFIGALSIPIGALLFWDLARKWKTPPIGWAALLLYPTFPLLLITIGSETPLYLVFCLAAFCAYARGRYSIVAVASALAVLTRPDGILVPVILGLDYIIRLRMPIPWKAVLFFLGLTIPWFVFAWIYYHSPLPVTLAAKQGQGAMAISERFAPGLLTTAKPYLNLWHYRIETILMLLGVATYVYKTKSDRSTRHWGIFLLWPILYFLAFTILGVSRYFWYYAPLIPGFIALVGLGAAGVTTLTFQAIQILWTRFFKLEALPSSANLQISVSAIIVSLLLILAFFQIKNLNLFRPKTNARYLIYRDAGEWLEANTPEDKKVATLETGIIGYFAQRPMIDFAGLLQPAVASRFSESTTYSDAATWAVKNLRPDYLVLQEGLFPELEQIIQESNCEVVKSYPGNRYNYAHDLNVLACSY